MVPHRGCLGRDEQDSCNFFLEQPEHSAHGQKILVFDFNLFLWLKKAFPDE